MGKLVAVTGSVVFLVTLMLTLIGVLSGWSSVENLLQLTQMLRSWQVIGGMAALGFGAGFSKQIAARIQGAHTVPKN